ncbi:Exo-beta-13-glucanase [Pyrenophora tritici-repentis]|uniref:glucan endo-1,3-beta-D-glucosidase n=1 Tax=Pyrenophora tritici-repentis TaxID=45151 RepID=A0A2W1DCX3_9PLEO|nr:GPI-anchored cell wall beta-1-3-endoglucanase EglC [Pyrenophora tritici-repentis]KAG9376825.1 GPI-anchored cell wall beta-1,3-endoglucanase EglC [Pyrenophora tritici-repentis]KAI0591501.1 GPI-anchored cell wall beta-1-3-endoglucanase EglC [Pyrenophora tritici-repentis]KAI0626458.1 GPI-anchored cell wall beta-1-3-endoglucanase EglC [Pyrenophora tritici-repentis]KAI1512209.1 GPI-anchored cell wall beta-1,3-endoglucanase EglC [Pyrenophora tritici-repentis]
MKYLLIHLFLSPCLAHAASKLYTGFNYGSFWGTEANPKKKSDFLDGFNLARNLTTNTPFDTARLFTCVQSGTKNDPTEAFDAAVESKTNLFLGFWISPAQKGGSPSINNEMVALEKGFQKHGQALSDLIIGLSVGNEDVYRAEASGEIGLTAPIVGSTIAQVKKNIAASSFSRYMASKPIGHVDTVKYAVVDNADFIGITVYPYWNKDSIDAAFTSFQGSVAEAEKRAGGRPIWIAEMGWPTADSTQHGAAVAGVGQLQRFWKEVGCWVFSRYTTFWFELVKDSTPEQKADWGFVDGKTRAAKIKDLSCGGAPKPSSGKDKPVSGTLPPLSSTSHAVSPAPSTVAPTPSTILTSISPSPSLASPPGQSPPHATLTSTITLTPIAIISPSPPYGPSPETHSSVRFITLEATVVITTTPTVGVTTKPTPTPVKPVHAVTLTVVENSYVTIGAQTVTAYS